MHTPAFVLLPSMSVGSWVFLVVFTVSCFSAAFLLFRYVEGFDQRFKIIAAAGAVYLAVLAGWRFLDERHRQVERSFVDRQLTLCLAAGEAAATIAASYNPVFAVSDDELHKSRQRFQQLYYGSLATVEDNGVAKAMIDFQEIARNAGLGSSNHEENRGLKQKLDCKILNLADACRKMIQVNWEIQILDDHTTKELKKSTAPTESKVSTPCLE